ncbi:hypothetical protein [Streptomyces sp. NBC_01217]|uniref:hypothetical protein n=1 Tax=Streptomyces sp. NBC_01217 TaxID=2903779 RepID=UPI002E0E579A|nr:hypothetical protein OG507_28135 [Streptomyces sp. NBC_01217]
MGKAAPAASDAARETLGGAVAVARRLPHELRDTVLSTAFRAFTHSMNMAAAGAAAAMAGAALLSVVLLRSGSPSRPGQTAPVTPVPSVMPDSPVTPGSPAMPGGDRRSGPGRR